MNTQPEVLGLNMTIAEALESADEWTKGCTFHAGSQGWRVVCALLAWEVRRLHAENEVLKAQRDELLEALKFYADRDHFNISDETAWDTVSGEPQNYWCDEAGTATVEDGTIARAAIASVKDAA